MKVTRCNSIAGAVVALLLCLASGPAMSAALDGSSSLICASMNVVACTEDGCQQGEAKSFELPDFMVLDVEQKVIRATHFSGVKEVSPVKNMETSGSQLIVQGVEEGHGWIMSIHNETGALSATVTGETISFIVFGACTPI